jgi:3-oxoacyl-[acyl-carrier protein] reductase
MRPSGRSTLDEMGHFNLTRTSFFTHAAAPDMKRQRSGKIREHPSNRRPRLSQSSSSAYATIKRGIIALTRNLAFELEPHGITVNAIAPSLTCPIGSCPMGRSGSGKLGG